MLINSTAIVAVLLGFLLMGIAVLSAYTSNFVKYFGAVYFYVLTFGLGVVFVLGAMVIIALDLSLN
jgi:hypothetical protein